MSSAPACGRSRPPNTGELSARPSCGWKGERFTQPPDGDYGMDWAAAVTRARTAKPCPRCGGRVEAAAP